MSNLKYQFESDSPVTHGNVCMPLADGRSYVSFHPNVEYPPMMQALGFGGPETAIIAEGHPVLLLKGDFRATIEHLANEVDGDPEEIVRVYKQHPERQIVEAEDYSATELLDEQAEWVKNGEAIPRGDVQ